MSRSACMLGVKPMRLVHSYASPCIHREGRDPRFASARARRSDADVEVAAKRYAFLYTDVLAKEKAGLKAELKVQRRGWWDGTARGWPTACPEVRRVLFCKLCVVPEFLVPC